ncbi:MAG: ATP-binding cassette domain-containing protein [Burkholderiales bacterium]|nr:ATP-binding cassette domain-containing protein [Burkholderiales bacterium]
MSKAILQAHGVSKKFGSLKAVNNVNFSVNEFEIVGILGSNGAGKTTFFNLLTGLFFPDEGSISLKGEDITRMTAQERVAKGLTRTFQLTSTFDNLNVTDNLVLVYFRANHQTSAKELLLTTRKLFYNNPKILSTLETFNLLELKDRQVQHLSLGEKRRLEIAMAVLAEPEVLLLDEPLAGLADSEIRGVLEVLRRHIGKQTIVLVEHKISHIEKFVERLMVMHEGRVIAEGGYEDCLNHPEVRRSYWQIEAD